MTPPKLRIDIFMFLTLSGRFTYDNVENGQNTSKKVSSLIFSLSNAAKQSPLAIFPAEIWPKQIFAPENSLKISFWRIRALRKSKWPETCFFGRDGPKYTHIGKN